MKLLIAVTSDISVRLLTGQLDYLVQEGFDVHLVVSRGTYSEKLSNNQHFTVHYIDMARDISLKKDLLALIQMIGVFREVQPDIANVGTPKAGLLGSIAAFVTRTKRRVYTLRGLRLETATGVKRFVLKCMEQLTINLSTEVIAISPSLIKKCEELGLKGTQKMIVLGKGSSNGIHVEKFDVLCLEKCLNPFSNNRFVIGFTGRLTKDKGIEELIEAFKSLNNCNLLLVGGLDEHHGLKETTIQEIETNPNIVMTGFIPNPAPFYKYMDLFVIPSYREGFSNVCLEAAAANLAIIGTDVTGIMDAVVDCKTGRLVAPYSSEALQQAISHLIRNNSLCDTYGRNGRKRVINYFQSEDIWQQMSIFYQKETSSHV